MLIRILCWLLLTAATACYADRAVGVSKGDKLDEPAPAKAKVPTRILAQPGQIVNFTTPRLGDFDGDGFDDFVLWGQETLPDGDFDPNKRALYLFYGKAEFPTQLSTADADAAFEVDIAFPNVPVGDLNGDGFSDLMLVRMNSVEFIFGGKERLHGAIAANSAGAVWMAGALPAPFAAGFTTQFLPLPAGDVDGDGCADLIVGATALVNPEPDGTGGGLLMRPYLIRGYRGEWASAVWTPDWAAAGFGFDAGKLDGSTVFAPNMQSLIYPERAGDIDGDGRDDLLAKTAVGSLVFYGRTAYPREVTSREADARLLSMDGAGQELAIDMQPWLLGRTGDLDADGMDDLALVDPINGDIGFVYGQRWSGEVGLAAEFTLELEFPGLQSVESVATGDIDGDGLPELLLNVLGTVSIEFDLSGEPIPAPQSVNGIYVVRGTGERLVGRVKLSENDRWHPRGVVLPNALDTQVEFSVVGDIDGDGGQDVLTNLLTAGALGEAELAMYLVPSTPRSPD